MYKYQLLNWISVFRKASCVLQTKIYLVVFQLTIGKLIGTNCVSLFPVLFLDLFEADFMENLVKSEEKTSIFLLSTVLFYAVIKMCLLFTVVLWRSLFTLQKPYKTKKNSLQIKCLHRDIASLWLTRFSKLFNSQHQIIVDR